MCQVLKPGRRQSFGLTIQNRVSFLRYGENRFDISAVTMTCVKSSLIITCLTSPISTFLYLIFVLLASSPSAAQNVIGMVGP